MTYQSGKDAGKICLLIFGLLICEIFFPNCDLPTLLGDFDQNGIVNLLDFSLFVNHYGYEEAEPMYDARYDIYPASDTFTGIWSGIFDCALPDGRVNLLDFSLFVKNYGKEFPVDPYPDIQGTWAVTAVLSGIVSGSYAQNIFIHQQENNIFFDLTIESYSFACSGTIDQMGHIDLQGAQSGGSITVSVSGTLTDIQNPVAFTGVLYAYYASSLIATGNLAGTKIE